MLSLIFCLVVVSWLSIPCNALPGILAPRTSGVDSSPSTAVWTPRPTTFAENVHKRVYPASLAVPTSAMGSHGLSHGASAGIAVGVGLLIVFVAVVISFNIYKYRHQRKQISFKPTTESLPESSWRGSSMPEKVQTTSPVATFFALPDGQSRSARGMTPFKDDSVEYRFMALMELFGPNGVPLRELITLASLRMSTKTSHNHWQIDGERGPLRDTIDGPLRKTSDIETTYGECSFLAAFARETSTNKSIEIFQERLVSLGLVTVEYQDPSEKLSSAQKCWFMDGRIWCINQRFSFSKHFRIRLLLDVYLEVFTEMPCKDISPLAERQREIHYSHAHVAIIGLFRFGVISYVKLRATNQVILVILQVLSHRFLKEDEALLEFAKENMPMSGLHPDWNMILLMAEVKATIFTNYENLSQIKDQVFQVVKDTVTRGDFSPRAKGWSGWLLVELLDAAEAQDRVELIDAVVQTGKQWVQRLLGSALSSLEQTVLCQAIARFGTSDHPEPQPRQYDLLIGYQLSRVGYIEKAEELLLSGLEFYASSPISTRLWSYRFELVSLMLRAERWSEAEAWLASARKYAMSRNQIVHDADFWKRSGECGETFILLGLYQADCNMAMGKLQFAEECLRNTME